MSQIHTPASYYDPPVVELVDEDCSAGGHVLDEHVYAVGSEYPGEYLCSGCVRERLLSHFRNAPANDLCDMPFEIYPAERCDAGCGMYRCQCPEER